MPRGEHEPRRLRCFRANALRWHCASRILVAVLGAVVLAGTETGVAHAGDYVIRSCSVPGYPNAPLAPWTALVRAPTMEMVDECAAGGGVGFRFIGLRHLYFGQTPILGLGRPSSGPQSQIQFVKVSVWYSARLQATGHPLSVWSYDNRTIDDIGYWMTTGPPGAENLSFEQRLSPATALYQFSLACAGIQIPPDPPPDPCVADDPMPWHVQGLEVTLSEGTPPTVSPPDGTLLADGLQSGVRTLSYAASDRQSGLAKVDVLLGDSVVKSHDLSSRCANADLTVCPASTDETLEVDTRSVPNGSYDLALRVRDAAGNEQVVHGTRPIEVRNEPPSSTAVATFAIAANFKGSTRSSLTVPYGRRVSLRGRVTQGSQPVGAGVALDVLERPDRRGARERRTRTVMTKSEGTFSIGLATSRPSRVVRLAYRPAGAGVVMSRALKLRVAAASRVRASLRGRVVHFSGRVLSGPLPTSGKRVQMEGRSPGSAWTPFKTLRTDKKGRFAGTYRLRVRRPGVVLKVRAVVPSETGYGYLGSRSRAVTLRVR